MHRKAKRSGLKRSVRVLSGLLRRPVPLSSRSARVAAWGVIIRARAGDATEGRNDSFCPGESVMIVAETGDSMRGGLNR